MIHNRVSWSNIVVILALLVSVIPLAAVPAAAQQVSQPPRLKNQPSGLPGLPARCTTPSSLRPIRASLTSKSTL